MGQPAAKANDQVTATDIHIVMVPAGPSLVPTPLPHPFAGPLSGGLIATVKIGGQAAAVVGSTADNTPAHIPTPPGTSFQKPPSNTRDRPARQHDGEASAASRPPATGDVALTCNDPADAPVGQVVAAGMVRIGG